jgi:hypothetical protein
MKTVLFCGIAMGGVDETETPEAGPDIPESNPITRILSTRSKAIVLDSWFDAGVDVPLVICSKGVAITKGILSLLLGSWGF